VIAVESQNVIKKKPVPNQVRVISAMITVSAVIKDYRVAQVPNATIAINVRRVRSVYVAMITGVKV